MMRRRQQGIALVMVLWLLILITVATGAFALMARMDQLEANQLLSGTQARMWAEAGLHLTAVALQEPDDALRMVADGRPYYMEMEGVLIEVRATDERGKLDINLADEQTLATLFTNNGMDLKDAEMLAAAMMDWKDGDDTERVNGAELDAYLAEGYALGPANRYFMMVEELLQVMGMTYDLFHRLEPGISVYSRTDIPQLGFASAEALMSLPDITWEEALNFVEQRQSQDPKNMLGTALPTGQTIMAQGRGVTYSIQVKATMPNGVWEQIDATIRLGVTAAGQPFRVLRWQEGFHY